MKSEWKHDFNLRALTTITRNSIGHEKEIVDEYVKLGFDGIFLRYLNNIGFAKKIWDKIGYRADEFVGLWERTLDYLVTVNRKTQFFEQLTMIFLKKLLGRFDPMFVDIQSPCGAAIGQMLYKYNGDIHTCDEGKLFPELKLGNVKTTSYRDVFKTDVVKKMIDISSRQGYLCDHCVWNPFCGICPIYTHSNQGTIISKLVMDDRCQMNKKLLGQIITKLIHSDDYKKLFLQWTKNRDVLK